MAESCDWVPRRTTLERRWDSSCPSNIKLARTSVVTRSISSCVHIIDNQAAICRSKAARTHTHTPIYRPLSGTTWVSQYQKCKTNLDFTEARDSEWQWHQLGHMQICNSLQTDNHSSTPPLSFLQAGCPSCHPTNSNKALKALQSTEGTSC